ncbi:Crp/Fnr family transcriptional regulator [Siccirubricoccus sp. G192]|uniref:Crp/Fnr family transcriptional regulator n=1 Tax=Siccirubricoccus sp. G192 TaxID=2849651 RepID=UPI001C2CAABA|nr:Crp/Fnr family transcriptional regulator [Siccirubricoccus sp. G192]MBV1797068.1 Crp/Fnr family transcriptional regulator [Siccirubricoccus sp. G192]
MSDPDRPHAEIRNRLLTALPPDELARLRPRLEPVELPFNQTLYAAGSRVDAVLFLESGMVCMLATLGDGGQAEVGIAGREGMVGLATLLGVDLSLTEARVQMDGTALRIGVAAFREALDRSAGMRSLLLRYALAFHGQVAQIAACNAHHAIERRLARWLLMAHDRAEADEFPMTHEFVSMMLGVRRPGVSVAAAMLQKSGLIHYARGHLRIVDRPGLEAASCECYVASQNCFENALIRGPERPHG